ncbi:MAG: glycosyltransferase family 2 protein [Candidatus Acidiferrales bacterium]
MSIHASDRAPLFSVILPTRDRPEMLPRAVSSVLSQSLPDFELIIVDDGSVKPCDAGLPGDARIRILRNVPSLGVAHARNMGIQAARGRYISFLDDDDEYLPSFLQLTHESLKDSPEEIGISWCGVRFIDDSSTPASSALPTRTFEQHNNRESLVADFLTIGTGFGVTIKPDCLKKVGLFNDALKVASDSDMFIRILAKGFTPMALPGVHVVRHHHSGARLQSFDSIPERIRTWEWFLSQYAGFLDENPVLRTRFVNYIDTLRKKLKSSSNQASGRGRYHASRLLSRLWKASIRLVNGPNSEGRS